MVLFLPTRTTSSRKQWHPTPVLFPGKSRGRRSLVGCCLWGRYESDMTERLHCHFSLSCIGEEHGNPLQHPCLENSRNGEPGGLLSMGSPRVGHDWSDSCCCSSSNPLGVFICLYEPYICLHLQYWEDTDWTDTDHVQREALISSLCLFHTWSLWLCHLELVSLPMFSQRWVNTGYLAHKVW